MMNRTGSVVLCVLVAILLAGVGLMGCGSDDGGGPDLTKVSDLEGSWIALTYQVTSVANPQMSLEFVSLGGGFAWDADGQGNFAGRAFVPEALAGTSLELPFQGTFDLISQDSIEVIFDPEIPPFLEDTRAGFSLSGGVFTIVDENTTFDFNGDEIEEPAIFEATLAKYQGTGPAVLFVSDFEGHWEVTTYRVTSAANPEISLEAISMGASFTFDLDDEGQFLGDVFIPAALAGEDITISDSPGFFYLVSQDTVQVNFTPEVPPFLTTFSGAFSLVGDDLSVVDTNSSFDFDGDMVEEDAIFEGTMVRTEP